MRGAYVLVHVPDEALGTVWMCLPRLAQHNVSSNKQGRMLTINASPWRDTLQFLTDWCQRKRFVAALTHFKKWVNEKVTSIGQHK